MAVFSSLHWFTRDTIPLFYSDVEVGGPSDGDDDVPTVSDEHLRDYKTASVIKKEQPPAQATG